MKEQASTAFNQALRLYPESPEANFRFADHLKRSGQFGQVETVLTKYIKTNPSENHITRAKKYLEDLTNTKQANNRAIE